MQRSGVDLILRLNLVTSNSQILRASPAGQTNKASLPLRQCSNVTCNPSDMTIRITSIIIVLLLSFESLLSQGNDINQTAVKKIEGEFVELTKQYLKASFSHSDSVSALNDMRISKLLELYRIDSTNRIIGMYMVDCYSVKNDLRQIIRWSNHALKYATDYKPNIISFNESIGFAYTRLGLFDSAKIHFKIYLSLLKPSRDSYQTGEFIKSLFNEADLIYEGKDTLAVKNLTVLRERSCKYYLQILDFIMPYAEKYMDKYFLLQRKEEKSLRVPGCR